jgi:hypothetical protein
VVLIRLAPLLEAKYLLEAKVEVSLVLGYYSQSNQVLNDIAIKEIETRNMLD